MHCLLWIADVTQYGVNDTVEVAQYIDQVISFQRTWDDEELDRLVELQVHKHIRTCNTHALTHSLLRLTSEGRTSTTSDPAPITVQRVDCAPVILFRLLYPGLPWPTRWTGRCQSGAGHLPSERLTQCWRIVGLARLVVGGKHVLAMSVFCRL